MAQISELQDIKKALLKADCYWTLRYNPMMQEAVTENAYCMVMLIMRAAEAAGDSFIVSVCTNVNKYKKMSEKQAYCLARFAAAQGMSFDDEEEVEEEVEEEEDDEPVYAIAPAKLANFIDNEDYAYSFNAGIMFANDKETRKLVYEMFRRMENIEVAECSDLEGEAFNGCTIYKVSGCDIEDLYIAYHE